MYSRLFKYMHAQLLGSGLDTRTKRGMFINYWDRVNTNLDTSTFFLFTCKWSIIWLHSAYRREHKKSITWRYGEHFDVANVTSAGYNGVNAIVTASILLNVHTIQTTALHMTLNPLILHICSDNIRCYCNAVVSQCNTPHSMSSTML